MMSLIFVMTIPLDLPARTNTGGGTNPTAAGKRSLEGGGQGHLRDRLNATCDKNPTGQDRRDGQRQARSGDRGEIFWIQDDRTRQAAICRQFRRLMLFHLKLPVSTSV
jgi:hypothetical protein